MVLWRHGRTSWNASGRFQGQTDIDLDEVGREQAARAAPLLASLEPAVIVSSDLRRAAGTAAPLAAVTGLPVAYDLGLRETDAGRWEGLTVAEIERVDPVDAVAWHSGDVQVRLGGGETRLEVAARAVAALSRAVRAVPAGGTLVAVTHGGTTRAALSSLLGLPTSCWGALGGLSNCCWSVLVERDGGWRLVEHNARGLPEAVATVEG